MRILLIPRIKETNGTSSFTIDPLNLVKYFRKIDKNCFFYIAVHEDYVNKSWLVNYGLTKEDIDHVQLIPMSHDIIGTMKRRSTRRASYFFSQALHKHVGPKDPSGLFIDAVIAESVLNVPMIRSIIDGLYQKGYSCRVPFFAWVHWCPVPKWYTCYYNEFDSHAEVYGSLFCDGVIFASERQKRDFKETWKNHFKSSVVSQLMENSILCNLGVEIDKIKRKKCKLGEVPTVLWSGYTSEDYDEVSSVLCKEVKLGRIKAVFQFLDEEEPVEEIYDLNTVKGVQAFARIRPYSKYLEFLQSADIFVAISQNIPRLTYGRRWGEMIASGLVPIVSRDIRDTFLPDDYLFTVTPELPLSELLPATIKYLRKKTDVLDYAYDYFHARHDIVDSCEDMYSFIHEYIQQAREETKTATLQKAVREALGDLPKVSHWGAVGRIEECMDSKHGCGMHSLFSQRFVRAAILKEGFTDVGGLEPSYARLGKV